MTSVALVSGSIRAGSLHRRLGAVTAAALGERGIVTDVVDLAEYDLPIYHGDDEERDGVPASAVALHDRLAGHDGLLVLSPEYNGGPSALLKNAIDWVTRVDRATLRVPLVGFMSTSPGSRGGVNGLTVLRSIGEHMRLRLARSEFSLPDAGAAFAPVGEGFALARPPDEQRLGEWLDEYVAELGGATNPSGVDLGTGR